VNAILVEGSSVRWGQLPDPVPGPGEVAIRVYATAVNRADLLQRRGAYPPPEGASPILGLECSGTVLRLGPGATGLSVGDPVCALLSGGGYAEIVTCPVAQTLPVPREVDLLQAAALPEALATTWMALRLVGELGGGERVLVHAGASGIGTAMVQVCRAWGNPCFVTCSSEEKVARCLALGADGGSVRGGWEEAVRRWAPDGVHVIVDPVGQGYVEKDQRVLARGGRIVLLGLLGGMEAKVDLARLLTGQQRLMGTTLRSRPAAEKARIMQGVAREIWPLVTAGKLAPVIDRVLPITETDAAHAVVAANQTVGKVVLWI
jgi:putative PIG3 family NAD(P)H quinone oxidoreductase